MTATATVLLLFEVKPGDKVRYRGREHEVLMVEEKYRFNQLSHYAAYLA